MTRTEPSELQIHIAVVQHLRQRGAPGLIYWHSPNGGLRDKREAAKLKAMGVRPGVSDLILFHRSRLYCLELKAKGGRAQQEQLQFISDTDREGALTALVEGLDAAVATLESWGLLIGRAA